MMIKVIRITKCQECPYMTIVPNPLNPSLGCAISRLKDVDKETIPAWCPLESLELEP
ncbi:hypothetical protein Tfer_0843 [Thermincola ferriacetica]|uniref:Uncharacterized protein n=1 Tax=Thermincola ferriacetica TaxID=281456 RepID=A0A0L6W4G0_9FIRM|nr:hypothetical protein Tfer_0843 [Thermincola ferriacetica]